MPKKKLIRALNKVLSSHSTTEKEEAVVEAGFKDFLKSIGKALLGVLLFAESALGFSLQRPERAEKVLKNAVVELAEEYGSDDTYTVQMKETKKEGIQYLVFDFIKNNKVAARVTFLGTKTDIVNNVEFKTYTNDPITAETARTFYNYLLEKIKKHG